MYSHVHRSQGLSPCVYSRAYSNSSVCPLNLQDIEIRGIQMSCGFKGHMLELLYACEYTQGERAWERGYSLLVH